MGYRRELINACTGKDRLIQHLDIQITQLEEEKNELQRNLQQHRMSAPAEKELALCRYNTIWTEKEEVDAKLVQMEKVVCDLQEENSSLTNQVHRLEQEAQLQRRTIWGVISSLFVVGAASLCYALSRR